MTAPVPAVFTRDEPVTKIELWNCFHDPATQFQFRDRLLVEARAIIGLNAPKYLINRGYAAVKNGVNADYLGLTAEGQAWLLAGISRFLKNHPERAKEVTGLNGKHIKIEDEKRPLGGRRIRR